ncbi:MAG: SufD family Fe-S cluster assembly protein [Pyrobaculum sp.]
MDIQTAKSRGAELAQRLPWQEVADSPAVRYYTDWTKFEGFSPLAEKPRAEAKAAPCEIVVVDGALAGFGGCDGVEVNLGREVFSRLEINSKILALHASAIGDVVEVKARGKFPPLVIKVAAGAEGRHVASHLLLDVDGEGAVAVYATSAEKTMHTVVVEGSVRGAVEYVLASNASGPQYVHSALAVETSISARPLVLGGVMNAVREEYLIGEGAAADVIGLELGFGESRIDHVVSVVNDAPKGKGYAKLYAVAAERSFVTQRAVGRITKRGIWSDSAVEGVVYIAGEGAVANTQPVILVETGEVSGARHSAADASLDEDKEFFLRARGVRRGDLPKLIAVSLVDQYLASLSDKSRPFAEEVLTPVLQRF